MPPLRSPRVHEREALRREILDAARKLFAGEGYARVTMRRIAAEIGYSATTIYHHFPDKLALFHAICDEDFDRLRVAFAATQAAADPVERLRLLGHGYLAFAEAHPNQFRLMFMTQLADAERQSLVTASADKRGDPARDAYALLVTTVQAAIDAGRIRPAWREAQLAAQTLWAAVHGLCALDLDHGNDPWVAWSPRPERARALVEAVLAGMTLPPSPPDPAIGNEG